MPPAKLRPARLVSPGIILRRELDARGWTQRDLAGILGRPAQAISEIVQGSKRITAETALELSAALGTSAEVWLQLDAGYRLRMAEERPETAAALRAIVKRSRERAGAPHAPHGYTSTDASRDHRRPFNRPRASGPGARPHRPRASVESR
jgi:addiction module HigA family antidote